MNLSGICGHAPCSVIALQFKFTIYNLQFTIYNLNLQFGPFVHCSLISELFSFRYKYQFSNTFIFQHFCVCLVNFNVLSACPYMCPVCVLHAPPIKAAPMQKCEHISLPKDHTHFHRISNLRF
jgi:hypothetical protein